MWFITKPIPILLFAVFLYPYFFTIRPTLHYYHFIENVFWYLYRWVLQRNPTWLWSKTKTGFTANGLPCVHYQGVVTQYPPVESSATRIKILIILIQPKSGLDRVCKAFLIAWSWPLSALDPWQIPCTFRTQFCTRNNVSVYIRTAPETSHFDPGRGRFHRRVPVYWNYWSLVHSIIHAIRPQHQWARVGWEDCNLIVRSIASVGSIRTYFHCSEGTICSWGQADKTMLVANKSIATACVECLSEAILSW